MEQRHEITAETMAGDLLAALVQEVRLLPDVWPKLPQGEQDELIERLRNRVTTNVRAAVETIVADGRVTVAADLEAISFKDGCKVTLKVDKNAAGKHDLVDAVGLPVLVVLANPGEYMGGVGDVKGDSDQRALDLQAESDRALDRAARGPDAEA